ncbi:hypothetical protein FIBSPDRAFT_1040049 [Athelia psychrophila]|uniref:DUF6533 domain-containing protein n=1 Tax=Athelia psychrophila TaxID=1759441 RepID=A0A166LS26_9AGAM|nr:hypothetical protein FIBSPDRAFT_1042978 [Fibularhizoctonia sp. CBS 109695]KZP27817.1 hypothetical protein FIBSPDRAFT_1040049 [Fibularhizoctonia sp. CBS 109695]
MAQLAAHIQSQLNANCLISLVSFVILCYDYCLTFADEVDCFWDQRGFTWASLLYFMNRYLALFGNVPMMFAAFWEANNLSKKTLVFLQRIVGIQSILPDRLTASDRQWVFQFCAGIVVYVRVNVAVLLIMRIYAMYGQSRWIIAVFAVVDIATIALGCWASLAPVPAHGIHVYHAGCSNYMWQNQADRVALAWSGQLCFDALIFALTLYKSFALRRSRSKHLINTILRDGSLYFAIITAANLANIVTILTAAPFAKGAATLFTNAISATMMSRLMLNLRDPRRIGARTCSSQTTEGAVDTNLPVMTSVFAKDDERQRQTYTHTHEDIEMIPRDCRP